MNVMSSTNTIAITVNAAYMLTISVSGIEMTDCKSKLGTKLQQL